MKWFFGFILFTLSYTVSIAQTNSLNHYIELAKSNSPLLKDLKTQVALNQLDSMRIRAGYKPQVNATSTGLYAPVVGGYGYAAAITNEHTLNALMGINQSLDSKKNISAQVDAITLLSQSVNNTAKISEQDLTKAVTAQYITAYGSLQQLKFNQEVIELLNKEEDLLKKLTRSNVYKQSDYLTFLVTLKQQQLQLSQWRMQYKNDYATLNYLTGIADTSYMELQEPGIQKTMRADISNSIFFNQYKVDSLKLVNSRALIDFTYRPKINLLADGGYNSDFASQPYKNFGLSVGFSFTLPLYDGGQRKIQYQKLSLQEQTRKTYKAFFDTQYHQQIAQLNQQIAGNETLLAQIDEQMKFTESLIKVDTKLLQTGDVRVADLILAINNYLSIKNLKTQTNITNLQLINQLNYWNR
ncbi:Outer membrane protein TolC [Mucilaginibacter pineti]|uniref:Outer membrane protein TolC n=1 Tax=Mucilaginibacter pineti TaxID=1391627 RepID=A0A1G7J6L6_9SPHI|nr:TolC family protein [Mucilaginibacter pineti]SDF20521.1 Outer membrane protein TolC [Mucilaginibacter pineti]